MPPARTHFCADAARGAGGVSAPVKMFLNGTMPALTNSKLGSLCGTSGAEGITAWSLPPKKLRNWLRTSLRLGMGPAASKLRRGL